jgi:hypothetical protein
MTMKWVKKSELSPGAAQGLDRGLLTHAQMQEIARKGGFELPDALVEPEKPRSLWWSLLVVAMGAMIVYFAFRG